MDEIKILFTGDYNVNPEFAEKINSELTFDAIFENYKATFQNADFRVVNFEVPITNSESTWLKPGIAMKTNALALKPLKAIGVDLLTFATNHTLDYGPQGIKDTVRSIQNIDIQAIGVGNNETEAAQIFYKEIKGLKFAFVNYCEPEFNAATSSTAGANTFSIINVFYQITEAKKQVDHVIIMLHGGLDYAFTPSPESVKMCRFMVDIGASAIIRHHSHYISAVESYKGRPIFYGLGHLISTSDYNDLYSHIGIMAQLNIKLDTINFEYIPIRFDILQHALRPLNDEEKKWFFSKCDKLSEIIKDKNILEREWLNEIIAKHRASYFSTLLGMPKLFQKVIKVFHLEMFLFQYARLRKKSILRKWNLIECTRHNEATTRILKDFFFSEKQ